MKLHGIETRSVELQVSPISTLDALREELLKHAAQDLLSPLRTLDRDDTIRRCGPNSEWAVVVDHGHHRGGTEEIPVAQGMGEFYGTTLEKLDSVRRAFIQITTKQKSGEGGA